MATYTAWSLVLTKLVLVYLFVFILCSVKTQEQEYLLFGVSVDPGNVVELFPVGRVDGEVGEGDEGEIELYSPAMAATSAPNSIMVVFRCWLLASSVLMLYQTPEHDFIKSRITLLCFLTLL